MNQPLDALLRHGKIWRGKQTTRRGQPTGFADLDAYLPEKGWPLGAVTEILVPQEGIGELRLVLPALAQLSRAGRWLVWIAPPHIPYPPALTTLGVDLSRLLLVRPTRAGDGLWAAEQALRSGVCGAVLSWSPTADLRCLRRLQLAAESGRALGLIFRPQEAARQPSPAALRLQLSATAQGLELQALKCRGGWVCRSLSLALDPPAPPPS